MFDKSVYIKRRDELKKELKNGIVLFIGNEEVTRNYPNYKHPYRQNSSFLYYFGHNLPSLDAIINIDDNEEILFGNHITEDDLVWHGPQASLEEKANIIGVKTFLEPSNVSKYLEKHKNKTIHYLPPYRLGHYHKLNTYLGFDNQTANNSYSLALINAIAKQRNIKEPCEIAEIEKALNYTKKSYEHLFNIIKPGAITKDIFSEMIKLTISNNISLSFSPIISTGNTSIHGSDMNYILKKGDILLIDSGFEIESGYCSDITRTIPIGTSFSQKQLDIYELVLKAQTEAIESLKPGLNYIDTYFNASKTIFSGLKDIGLVKGNTEDAINQGAHGLFFCHGLGHLLGLDAHDLEDLGEDYIGYDETIKRSNIFGIKFQRYAKKLEENFVITVEPGIYFMPELIKQWAKKDKFKEFINYDLIFSEYINFGGIRIEDDVLITKTGSKVLGDKIIKSVEDINKLY